jgi:uncharacterized protein YjbI with pentapeptide repeats
MEILTAFMRNNAAWDENRQSEMLPRPSAEIAAILTVLNRRNRALETEHHILRLGSVNLRGAVLWDVHFERANLNNVHLENSVAAGFSTNSQIRAAVELRPDSAGMLQMNEAKFELALSRVAAHFENAQMSNACLDGFIGSGCRFEGAQLFGARVRRGGLSWSHFEGANLANTDFEGTLLSNVNFRRAFMSGVKLKNANLDFANLEGAQLYGTDLREVVFSNCRMADTNLRGADIRGANLTTVIGLTREQLELTRFDDTTKLPEYLGGIPIPSATHPALLTEQELVARITVAETESPLGPTIRDLGLPVTVILEALAKGISKKDVLGIYHGLEDPDIRGCLLYAAKVVREHEGRLNG